jgi:hypothetical protein
MSSSSAHTPLVNSAGSTPGPRWATPVPKAVYVLRAISKSKAVQAASLKRGDHSDAVDEPACTAGGTHGDGRSTGASAGSLHTGAPAAARCRGGDARRAGAGRRADELLNAVAVGWPVRTAAGTHGDVGATGGSTKTLYTLVPEAARYQSGGARGAGAGARAVGPGVSAVTGRCAPATDRCRDNRHHWVSSDMPVPRTQPDGLR